MIYFLFSFIFLMDKYAEGLTGRFSFGFYQYKPCAMRREVFLRRGYLDNQYLNLVYSKSKI